jgi:type IV pilus assembly protein PilC
MFESGIPILQGLDSANQVISNKYLKDSFDKVKDAVEAGNALSSSMKKWGSFPPLVIRMIKVGEDSGRLEKTLKNVTDFYDREVEDTIEALIGFLKVGLIVIVGIFVLWIVLSVIAPIYDSLQNLGI